MKKFLFDNLPAGSIILIKKYNLFERFKAWVNKKQLKYNDGWIDPFGGSTFLFKNTFWTKHDVVAFIPKKKYNEKEMYALFNKVLTHSIKTGDPIESLLMINLIRPNTFKGTTFEELLEGNKFYIKKEIK